MLVSDFLCEKCFLQEKTKYLIYSIYTYLIIMQFCMVPNLQSQVVTSKTKGEIKLKKYTIKSTSSEGIHYLVNGWYKAKTFWLGENFVKSDTETAKKYFFNKPSQAKSSLTKLLKIMPDYSNDKFEIIEFE